MSFELILAFTICLFSVRFKDFLIIIAWSRHQCDVLPFYVFSGGTGGDIYLLGADTGQDLVT